MNPTRLRPGLSEDKSDPEFQTKPQIALKLVRDALELDIPFRAVAADSFYGEQLGLKDKLDELCVGCVLALKPSHCWWASGQARRKAVTLGVEAAQLASCVEKGEGMAGAILHVEDPRLVGAYALLAERGRTNPHQRQCKHCLSGYGQGMEFIFMPNDNKLLLVRKQENDPNEYSYNLNGCEWQPAWNI